MVVIVCVTFNMPRPPSFDVLRDKDESGEERLDRSLDSEGQPHRLVSSIV
jgi:hypothetical protein